MTVKWIALFAMLVLSGFFSAAETSLTTFNRIKIREKADQGNKSAARLLQLSDEKQKMLTAILIGNNIVNIAASAIATTIALSIDFNVGVMTLLLTLIILVFGEITPKNAATVKAETLALFYVRLIYALMFILTPVISIINLLCKGVLRIIGINMEDNANAITEGELRTIVDVSHEHGVIESEEKEMIKNVFDFGDSRARDIMIPRIDVIEVELGCSYETLRDIFEEERYTRIPVYKDSTDNIIGVVNMKDFFLNGDSENFRVTDIMRDAYFTYETKSTADLLVEMKRDSAPMAIVLNEYGAAEGIVTMEDLIEEIVGEIRDEFDEAEAELIENTGDREYLIEASVKLDDLNDELGTNLESEDYDSVGGYIIGMLDRIPQPGEAFENDEHIIFEITEGTVNRIDKVKMTLPKKESEKVQSAGAESVGN